ncbi:hypothetical protein [Agrobacterium sp. CG674]
MLVLFLTGRLHKKGMGWLTIKVAIITFVATGDRLIRRNAKRLRQCAPLWRPLYGVRITGKACAINTRTDKFFKLVIGELSGEAVTIRLRIICRIGLNLRISRIVRTNLRIEVDLTLVVPKSNLLGSERIRHGLRLLAGRGLMLVPCDANLPLN